MRIAIDTRLNAYRRGGIPQYTRQLLTSLAEIAPGEEFISLQHREMLRPLAVAPNVVRRTIYTPPHHRLEPWTLPLELLFVRPQVLHFPDFVAPIRRPCPAVVTIHDLAFMHYPGILDDEARAFYSQVLTNTERSDAIIAVSEATRQDVVQFLDIPVEQVHVIYEAAAPVYRPMEMRGGEARVLNGKPVAEGSFMLFVSTLEPRKNLTTLLEALRICVDRRPDRPYKLVVIGGRGWHDEPIFATIRDLRLADYVLLAGSVGHYDLRWLYNACRFYINPSLYEGFGLPLLEAMACGAACLASATSSLPEIGGDAAIYVPALDPQQWADAIEALWDDEDRQQELGRIGLARAQRFSWTKAARETLKVYREVAERRERPVTAQPTAAPPRRFAEPPHPTVVMPAGDLTADAGERTCLRCANEMLPGQLQQHLRIQLVGADGSPIPLQPRAWACPTCGYAELVVEPSVATEADHDASVAAVADNRAYGLLDDDVTIVQSELDGLVEQGELDAVTHDEQDVLDDLEPDEQASFAELEPATAEQIGVSEAFEFASEDEGQEDVLEADIETEEVSDAQVAEQPALDVTAAADTEANALVEPDTDAEEQPVEQDVETNVLVEQAAETNAQLVTLEAEEQPVEQAAETEEQPVEQVGETDAQLVTLEAEEQPVEQAAEADVQSVTLEAEEQPVEQYVEVDAQADTEELPVADPADEQPIGEPSDADEPHQPFVVLPDDEPYPLSVPAAHDGEDVGASQAAEAHAHVDTPDAPFTPWASVNGTPDHREAQHESDDAAHEQALAAGDEPADAASANLRSNAQEPSAPPSRKRGGRRSVAARAGYAVAAAPTAHEEQPQHESGRRHSRSRRKRS